MHVHVHICARPECANSMAASSSSSSGLSSSGSLGFAAAAVSALAVLAVLAVPLATALCYPSLTLVWCLSRAVSMRLRLSMALTAVGEGGGGRGGVGGERRAPAAPLTADRATARRVPGARRFSCSAGLSACGCACAPRVLRSGLVAAPARAGSVGGGYWACLCLGA